MHYGTGMHGGNTGDHVVVRDHRTGGSYGHGGYYDRRGGYYGHGTWAGHRYFVGTHGWQGYSHGYRWGYHRFWRNNIWVWDYGYWYDPYYVGPLYYFDDGYVPDDIAPQPNYAPAPQCDDGLVPDEQGNCIEQVPPQDEAPAAPTPGPQQELPQQGNDDTYYQGNEDTYYQSGPGAPGNTPTR
jgi:hypothetical protein